MPDELQAAIPPSRLNPFAFPSDTGFRFILLIATVLASSLTIFANKLPLEERSDSLLLQCVTNYRDSLSALCPVDEAATFLEQSTTWQNCIKSSPAVAQAMEQLNHTFQRCVVPVARPFGLKTLFGGVLLWGIATLIYWFFPLWKIWRAKLVPLPSSDVPEIVTYLTDLCREVGLSRSPTFLWNPLNPAITGLAFGRLQRYYVALTGGLVTQFYTDRPAFRAILLHELAHLYNADVDKTYFAIATWQAFAVTALAALSLDVFNHSWKAVLAYSWRLLALAALVYLTRNAILRARELYADVRASLWDGADSALGQVLETLPRPPAEPSWRWLKLLQMHPDPLERRRSLTDTDRLFRLGYGEAFGAGVVTMVAFTSIFPVLRNLILDTPLLLQAFLLGIGPAVLLAPLAIGLVAMSIWRMTFAALARNHTPPRLGWLALATSLGLVLGHNISFAGRVSIPRPLHAELVRYGFVLLWYLLLFVCFFLFLHWIAAGASSWLERSGSRRRSHLFLIVGFIIVASVFFALWFGLLYLFWDGINSIYASQASPFELVLMTIGRLSSVAPAMGYYLPLVFCFIWAFPLSAWFLQKQATPLSSCSWAFLDPHFASVPSTRPIPLRPGFALAIGLLGGFIACIPYVPFVVNLLDPSADRISQLQSLLATEDPFSRLWLSQVLIQIIIAGIVSLKIKPFGWAHGMFAAFVVGCVAFAGVLLPYGLTGLPIEPEPFFAQFSSFIASGSVWALPVALTIPTLARWFHALPPRIPMREHASLAQGNPPIIGIAWGRRMIAFIIDVVIWYILSQTLFFLAVPLAAILAGNIKLEIGKLLNLYSEASLFALYFIVFEWLCGATIGKFVLGLYVIQAKGIPCSLKAAIIRNLIRCLDLLLLCVPTYVIWQASLQQSLGDKVAQTIVIEPSKQPGAWKRLAVTAGLYMALNLIIKQFVLVPSFR